ncbi:BMP family lipoprotein [Paratractidigestivibacter sp.]|uniref:BMP family lipoprotein n=1 Tax=Paratractidigestivibacter sp. TaxID=2847316 RepID=UPI002ABE0521|nr:BMP family ABC transporter substrate-binding protein [Paratractidigestivibacter sp.]
MSKINLDRRQFLGLSGAAAATMGLAACGGSSSSSSSDSSSENKTRKVAMIMSGTVTDGGWDQAHYESLKRAIESHEGWEMLEPKENTASADNATAAETYVDQDVDLIIGNGNQFASAWAEVVADAAASHPNVHFLITNTNADQELAEYENTDNVEVVLPDFVQLGSLAGVIAGLMTQTKSIGFIGGMKLPSTLNKYSAFLAAAQKMDASITGQYNFEAGFSDAAKGTQLAEQWIASYNVDVMWGDASAVDNGARKALESAGADTHFDISQPIDILGDSQPTVIASTVTDWKIDQAMDEIEAGTFGKGKAITANMENGGVSLGKFSDKIPADVQTKIDEYAEQIKTGSFLTDAEVEAIKSTL